MSLVFHRNDPVVQVAQLGGLVLVRMHGLVPELYGDPNAELLRAIDAAAAAPRIALIARVVDSRPPPDDARERLNAKIIEVADKVDCAVVCLDGGGFRAVAIRAFLAALRALNRVRTPIQIRSDFESARSVLVEAHAMDAETLAEVDRFFATPPAA